ncbi:MAG: WbqC family protein [Deferribacteres bacterium]|nr:WbqC family protein [candidate division KSB1 bacterium]MCB9502540.1 WbqC family protein [Deferribacteres bacterium]
MTFAAHKPEFIPDAIFWAKAIHASTLLLADDVQFVTKSKINRCLIKTVHGAQWLTIPVLTRGRGQQRIQDIHINNANSWRQKQWKSLIVNYKNAAYFEKYDLAIHKIYQKKYDFLIDFNMSWIEFLQKELSIDCKFLRTSELGAHSDGAAIISEWGEKIGCSEYLVEVQLRDYLEQKRSEVQPINIHYMKMQPIPHYQQFEEFIPGLSIIDMLLNEGDATKNVLSEMSITV